MMPGTRLLRFARLWFPPSTVSSVFEPLVADWQRQWLDATLAERRWIDVKGRISFVTTLVTIAPRLWMTAPPATVRVQLLTHVTLFWFITAAAAMLAFVPLGLYATHLWLLVPTFLVTVLPFTVVPAVDIIRRHQMPSEVRRQTVAKATAAATIGMAIGLAWIVPSANQAWRNEVVSQQRGRPAVASRGVKELFVLELITGDAANYRPTQQGERVGELSSRVSLIVLPALVALIRWRSPMRSRPPLKAALASGAAGIAIAVSYLALGTTAAAWEGALPSPGLAPWLSLAAFGLILNSISRRKAAAFAVDTA